jgi:hypothetical protein
LHPFPGANAQVTVTPVDVKAALKQVVFSHQIKRLRFLVLRNSWARCQTAPSLSSTS